MFTATRLVAATAIVVLFGGFMLARVMPTQPGDPSLPIAGASGSAPPSATSAATPAMSPVDGARTIVVAMDGSGDHRTLVEAIAASADGDIVLVRPGTYDGGILVEKDIIIRGDGDRADIIVRATQETLTCPWHASFQCAFWLQDSDATLANLTLVGVRLEDGWHGSLTVQGGAPTIEGVVADGDVVGFTHSTGVLRASIVIGTIQVNGTAARPTIEDNVVGGVSSDAGASPVVRRNEVGHLFISGGSGIFEDNRVIDAGTPDLPEDTGIYVNRPLDGLVIRDNLVRGHDIGIDVKEAGPSTISSNVIEGNGVGLRLDAIGDVDLSGNSYCGNTVDVSVARGARPADVVETCTGEDSAA